MDPLTFATIVQLLGMFKQERKEAKDLDHQKFMEWLEYHHHEEIKNIICNTAAIQTEVINLLRQDSAATLAQLDSINTTLAMLLSRTEGFQGLSKVMLPNVEISEQAVSILRQLVEANTTKFVYNDYGANAFFESNHVLLNTPDSAFLTDDLDTLEQNGLITQQPCNSDSMRIYSLTRAGAKYIGTMGQNQLP